MDFEAIKKAAQAYGPAMTAFLRDMIAIPSESSEEKGVVHRIAEEMEKVGFDKVEIDPQGNVLGWMGSGDRIIHLRQDHRYSSGPGDSVSVRTAENQVHFSTTPRHNTN